MLNKLTILTTCLIFSAISSYATDYHSPRTDALGGAGHASPLLTDAIYMNPSFGSFMQTHALSVGYLSYCCGTIPTAQGISDYYGHNFNVSVLDGTPESLFQAGVGYTRREDTSFVHIGASKSFFQQLGVGVGTKFIMPKDSSRITEATLSVSGLLTSWFQTALIVDNLFQSATYFGFYREFTLGTKFNVNRIFMVYIDPLWVPSIPNDQSAFGYQAGAEFPFFSEVFLRVGAFKGSTVPYQSRRGEGYSFGLGWIAPKISFDYAFSRVTKPIAASSHNFGIAIYF